MGLYAHVDLSDYIDYGEELLDMGNQIITGIYDEHLEDLDSGSGSDEAGV